MLTGRPSPARPVAATTPGRRKSHLRQGRPGFSAAISGRGVSCSVGDPPRPDRARALRVVRAAQAGTTSLGLSDSVMESEEDNLHRTHCGRRLRPRPAGSALPTVAQCVRRRCRPLEGERIKSDHELVQTSAAAAPPAIPPTLEEGACRVAGIASGATVDSRCVRAAASQLIGRSLHRILLAPPAAAPPAAAAPSRRRPLRHLVAVPQAASLAASPPAWTTATYAAAAKTSRTWATIFASSARWSIACGGRRGCRLRRRCVARWCAA